MEKTTRTKIRPDPHPEQWHAAKLHIAKYALPYLRALKEKMHGCPHEFANIHNDVEKGCKEWATVLGHMILAMELIVEDDYQFDAFKTGQVHRGCELFGKWFHHLWD